MYLESIKFAAANGIRFATYSISNIWSATVSSLGYPKAVGAVTALSVGVAVPVYLVAQPVMFVASATLALASPVIIPAANYRVAEYALNNGYNGLADFALSLSKACRKIPFVKRFFPEQDYLRLMNDGMLHQAVATGNFSMAKLLVRNGADINIETSNYASPLAMILDSKKPGADELALAMINKGADLSKNVKAGKAEADGPVAHNYNIFHQIIKSGKIKLIRAALAKLDPAKPVDLAILNSVDDKLNSIEHIAAANPNIKILLDQFKIEHPGNFTAAVMNSANKDKNTVLDIALISYKKGQLTAEEVNSYVTGGATNCNIDKIKFVIENQGLRRAGIARKLIEQVADYAIFADAAGKQVLAYAIGVKDDNLARIIAERTPDEVADTKLLGFAYRNQMPQTCEVLLQKCIKNGLDLVNFFNNPEEDGQHALHKFASGEWAFNQQHFMFCYQTSKAFLKGSIEENPLAATDDMQQNVLYHALLNAKVEGNYAAPKAILSIIAAEEPKAFRKLLGSLDNNRIELLAPMAGEIQALPIAFANILGQQLQIAIEDGYIDLNTLGNQVKLLQAPAARALAIQQ